MRCDHKIMFDNPQASLECDSLEHEQYNSEGSTGALWATPPLMERSLEIVPVPPRNFCCESEHHDLWSYTLLNS